MSDGDAGKKVPWWDRLAYTSLRDEKKLREKADAELLEKVKDRTHGQFTLGMIQAPIPGCISEPYQDAASAQVMPRHRGKQMQASYRLNYQERTPLCVGDPFAEDAGWKDARKKNREGMWADRKSFKPAGKVQHNKRTTHYDTDWYLSEVDCNVPNEKVVALAKDRIKPVQKTKFNHGDRKSFFIGQPTRKGGYGVPGTTFGEQFKGASGDVYKYKSELCTELAKIDQDKAERAYARKKRGERPGFKPASGHADSGKPIFVLHESSAQSDSNRLPFDRGDCGAKYGGNQAAKAGEAAGGKQEKENGGDDEGRKAFRPNGTLAKGNASYSLMSKFPEHVKDPYPDVVKEDGHHVYVEKKKKVELDDGKKWKPGSTSKYFPVKSIATHKSNLFISRR